MSRKRPRKELTERQWSWLAQIPAEGISEAALFRLRGKARQYHESYRSSIRSAIDRANAGNVESPLPEGAKIEAGFFGPRGGFGYRLTFTEPVLGVAHAVLKESAHGQANDP